MLIRKKKKLSEDELEYLEVLKEKEKAEKKAKKTNREILFVTYIFVFLFLCMIGYIIHFTAVDADSVINNNYNSRGDLLSKKILRGVIYSRDKEVLAETTIDASGAEIRNYPYGSLFAHAVGYSNMGNTGVESIANFKLLTSNSYVTAKIRKDLEGTKNNGNSVITTFDVGLQKAAYDSMNSKRGAVVAINCKTGEILAMVSKPDFDPNNIVELWDELNSEDNGESESVLLNRATLGLYPPGSTFKIVTALEYIKENGTIDNYEYICNGNYSADDNTINCFHGGVHGEVNLKKSFAKSCNSSFAYMSTGFNKEKFGETLDELLFNKDIPNPFSYKRSVTNINASTKLSELMQTGIGQGKTQVTPFHMALITSAIANDGILMKPKVISSVINDTGKTVKKYGDEVYGRLVAENNAAVLKELLEAVVTEGTASKLAGAVNYTAAGKTGSAEYSNDKNKSHAWFTGYAPCEDPEIVVTVIVEGGGTGGDIAVPIAKSVFDAYYAK